MRLLQKENGVSVSTKIENVNFENEYDIIVVGLGTAGAIAAIAAAKKGLKVLGIERFHCMGGMSTAGAVTAYYFGSKGGYCEELEQKVSQYDDSVYTASHGFNLESKKYVLEQEALKSGINLLYHTVVTGVFLEHKKVKGITAFTETGFKTFGCKILIDGTGDADVCDIMGCNTFYGRETDGINTPFTSMKVFIRNEKVAKDNIDSGFVDQTDITDYTKAIIASGANHLKENYANEPTRLLYIAPLLGIREGRRIKGEETVTIKDFFEGKSTDKPLFYAYADLDKHGRDTAFESDFIKKWFLGVNLGTVNISVAIPLGSFIPKGYEGVLVAGRCLSVDHDMAYCVRMMRDMQKSGEATGTAAWLAIKHGCSLKDVPYGELIASLKQTGCFNEGQNRGLVFDSPRPHIDNVRSVQWLADFLEIKSGLSSDKPGVAMWSAKLIGSDIKESLRVWMDSGECDELKKHSALALALMGERLSLPVIRDIIKERDDFMLCDGRKNNQLRIFSAIYYAGKFADDEITDELIDIICNPQEINRPLYHSEKLFSSDYDIKKFNWVYYQLFANSIAALLEINNKYPESTKKIVTALKDSVNGNAYIKRITSLPPSSCEYSTAENIKRSILYILR